MFTPTSWVVEDLSHNGSIVPDISMFASWFSSFNWGADYVNVTGLWIV